MKMSERILAAITAAAMSASCLLCANPAVFAETDDTALSADSMTVEECIDYVNELDKAAEQYKTDVGIYSVPISKEDGEIIQKVLDSDYEKTENSSYEYKYQKYDFSSDYYYAQLPAKMQKAYNQLDAACSDFLESSADMSSEYFQVVNFSEPLSSLDEVEQLYWCFYFSNPQYFFLKNGFSYFLDFSGVTLRAYDNCLAASDRAAIKNSIDSITDEYISSVSGMTDSVAKETAIANKISDRVTYSTAAPYNQSLMSTLYYKSSVCNGYAMTMNYFCNALGIDSIIVTSDGHAWNRVKLNGQWYEADVTWYDQEGHYWDAWLNKSTATFLENDSDSMHVVNTAKPMYNNITLPSCTDDDPADNTLPEYSFTCADSRVVLCYFDKDNNYFEYTNSGTVPEGTGVWIGMSLDDYVNNKVLINDVETELTDNGSGYWYNIYYTVNSDVNVQVVREDWSAERLAKYAALFADENINVWFYNSYYNVIENLDNPIKNGGYIGKEKQICIRIPSSVYSEKPDVYINNVLVDCSLNYDGMWQIWAYDVPDDSDVLRISIGKGPTKPANVTAVPGYNSVTLTWDAVPGASQYAVSYYTGSGYVTLTTSCTSTTYTASGLSGGKTYPFLVQAYVNGQWSPFTSADHVSATPAGGTVSSTKPANVTAVAGTNSVTLTWNAVPGASQYAVSYYTGSGYVTLTTTCTATIYTASGLTGGKTYSFLVQAYVNGQWSPFTSADHVSTSVDGL